MSIINVQSATSLKSATSTTSSINVDLNAIIKNPNYKTESTVTSFIITPNPFIQENLNQPNLTNLPLSSLLTQISDNKNTDNDNDNDNKTVIGLEPEKIVQSNVDLKQILETSVNVAPTDIKDNDTSTLPFTTIQPLTPTTTQPLTPTTTLPFTPTTTLPFTPTTTLPFTPTTTQPFTPTTTQPLTPTTTQPFTPTTTQPFTPTTTQPFTPTTTLPSNDTSTLSSNDTSTLPSNDTSTLSSNDTSTLPSNDTSNNNKTFVGLTPSNIFKTDDMCKKLTCVTENIGQCTLNNDDKLCVNKNISKCDFKDRDELNKYLDDVISSLTRIRSI